MPPYATKDTILRFVSRRRGQKTKAVKAKSKSKSKSTTARDAWKTPARKEYADLSAKTGLTDIMGMTGICTGQKTPRRKRGPLPNSHPAPASDIRSPVEAVEEVEAFRQQLRCQEETIKRLEIQCERAQTDREMQKKKRKDKKIKKRLSDLERLVSHMKPDMKPANQIPLYTWGRSNWNNMSPNGLVGNGFPNGFPNGHTDGFPCNSTPNVNTSEFTFGTLPPVDLQCFGAGINEPFPANHQGDGTIASVEGSNMIGGSGSYNNLQPLAQVQEFSTPSQPMQKQSFTTTCPSEHREIAIKVEDETHLRHVASTGPELCDGRSRNLVNESLFNRDGMDDLQKNVQAGTLPRGQVNEAMSSVPSRPQQKSHAPLILPGINQARISSREAPEDDTGAATRAISTSSTDSLFDG